MKKNPKKEFFKTEAQRPSSNRKDHPQSKSYKHNTLIAKNPK